jgi:hypothetical protein
MLDGAELAKAIAAHPGRIETALATYEEALFSRSAAAGAHAHTVVDVMFGSDTPYSVVERWKSS